MLLARLQFRKKWKPRKNVLSCALEIDFTYHPFFFKGNFRNLFLIWISKYLVVALNNKCCCWYLGRCIQFKNINLKTTLTWKLKRKRIILCFAALFHASFIFCKKSNFRKLAILETFKGKKKPNILVLCCLIWRIMHFFAYKNKVQLHYYTP